ncbi:hypothetical protein HDV05_004357 [Chytridiales sp. JEL 0842]|nr:hypothetical protein HDV05_004357 [Chytridiales sp. JEL 0842]
MDDIKPNEDPNVLVISETNAREGGDLPPKDDGSSSSAVNVLSGVKTINEPTADLASPDSSIEAPSTPDHDPSDGSAASKKKTMKSPTSPTPNAFPANMNGSNNNMWNAMQMMQMQQMHMLQNMMAQNPQMQTVYADMMKQMAAATNTPQANMTALNPAAAAAMWNNPMMMMAMQANPQGLATPPRESRKKKKSKSKKKPPSANTESEDILAANGKPEKPIPDEKISDSESNDDDDNEPHSQHLEKIKKKKIKKKPESSSSDDDDKPLSRRVSIKAPERPSTPKSITSPTLSSRPYLTPDSLDVNLTMSRTSSSSSLQHLRSRAPTRQSSMRSANAHPPRTGSRHSSNKEGSDSEDDKPLSRHLSVRSAAAGSVAPSFVSRQSSISMRSVRGEEGNSVAMSRGSSMRRTLSAQPKVKVEGGGNSSSTCSTDEDDSPLALRTSKLTASANFSRNNSIKRPSATTPTNNPSSSSPLSNSKSSTPSISRHTSKEDLTLPPPTDKPLTTFRPNSSRTNLRSAPSFESLSTSTKPATSSSLAIREQPSKASLITTATISSTPSLPSRTAQLKPPTTLDTPKAEEPTKKGDLELDFLGDVGLLGDMGGLIAAMDKYILNERETRQKDGFVAVVNTPQPEVSMGMVRGKSNYREMGAKRQEVMRTNEKVGVVEEPSAAAAVAAVAPVKKITTRIYIENATTYKTLVLTSLMTSEDVIMDLLKHHNIPSDPSWTLFELCNDLGIERPLRDWEIVTDVMLAWDTAISDPSKTNAVVLKKYKFRSTLGPASLTSKFPKMQGYVQLELKPGKWVKKYCMLKQDSIYYYSMAGLMGETLLCKLNGFDVFVANPEDSKLSSKRPTKHCFALRSTQRFAIFENKDEYVTFGCVNSQEKLNDWILAIRLAKSESTFLENPSMFDKYEYLPAREELAKEKEKANKPFSTTLLTRSKKPNHQKETSAPVVDPEIPSNSLLGRSLTRERAATESTQQNTSSKTLISFETPAPDSSTRQNTLNASTLRRHLSEQKGGSTLLNDGRSGSRQATLSRSMSSVQSSSKHGSGTHLSKVPTLISKVGGGGATLSRQPSRIGNGGGGTLVDVSDAKNCKVCGCGEFKSSSGATANVSLADSTCRNW